MKRGEMVEGTVRRVDFPNRGVVELSDGECLTVKGTLPGQRVRCIVQKPGKGKAKGRLLEVVERSADELAQPACVHGHDCGGCAYQTLPYAAQLALKERQVKSLLSPVMGDEAWERCFEGIHASPDICGYRNKMEFSFGDSEKGGPLALGMHKKGSFYDIVTAEQCQIIDGDMRQVLRATLRYFSDAGATFYHKMRHVGYLRHLLVRKAHYTGELLVDLVTSTDKDFAPDMPEEELLDGWRRALEQLPLEGQLAGVLHTRNDRTADVVEDQGTDILAGRDYFYEELLGLRFRISPFSFFQTNSRGAELLYDTAQKFISGENVGKDSGNLSGDIGRDDGSLSREIGRDSGSPHGEARGDGVTSCREADGGAASAEDTSVGGEGSGRRAGVHISGLTGKVVYDLYSGTGTIAQILAPVAGRVIGVEIVEEAVAAARENARLNHLDNCEFIAGDVLKVLDAITEKPDFIVLDPPRDGIHPKALEKIIGYGVDSLLYISCKPTSLARDLERLLAAGYAVRRLCCVDMFPGNPNVEVVCLLSHKKLTA